MELEAPWCDLDDERVLEALRIFESYLPRGQRLRWASHMLESRNWTPYYRVWSKRRLLRSISIDEYRTRECLLRTSDKGNLYAVMKPESRVGRGLQIGASSNLQPLLTPSQLRELLARMGTAIGAHRGKIEMFFPNQVITTEPTFRRRGWTFCRWPPAKGLPQLVGHVPTEQGGPPIGAGITWINYWNRQLCELAGFPPADRGAYFAARPLDDGGWVWQLTEDPLNWVRDDHWMQYKRALLAMPFIGNRDPRWPKPPPRQLGDYFIELHLACPPRGPASEDDRPLRLVESVERHYYDDIASGDTPPFPFEFLYDIESDRLAPKPPGTSRIPDRVAYLALPHEGDIPTLFTGGLTSNYLQGRHFDHPPPGYLYVRVFLSYAFPRQPTLAERRPDVLLETCARVMNAYWGRAILTQSREVTDWQVDAGDPRDVHPEGLPILRPPWDMPDIWTPAALGQVNYWSAETCRRVGFPPGGDMSVMAYAREVEGGWLWGLADETLWLVHPSPDVVTRHRAILRRGYERFGAVGGRSLPR